ncbi:MAG: D-alanine--D-alanine ligase [Desulfobacterales bacterium]|nr:D-alanine--D-alanine ligase [Desulfobacterales bacterium]
MVKKLTVALIAGGFSAEREVSLNSARHVLEALDKEKYRVVQYDPKTDLAKLVQNAPRIDVALIMLHGPLGEDGTVQGLLELLNIPYQGSGVLGSAVAMNKVLSKQLYETAGLPMPPYVVIHKQEPFNPETCAGQLGFPVVIKPANGGSSIGVSVVRTPEALAGAVETAFDQDDAVLMEAFLEGTELTVAVLGNDRLETLPVVEIIPDKQHPFFNYKAKYDPGATQEICPARIDDAMAERARTYAKMAHQSLFCRGYSRTDMILKDREIYVLETNTIPGMTANSLLPLSAKTAGISFSRLLDQLIDLGLAAHPRRGGNG